MTKLKKFVNTYNKIIFVLTLVLALTSIICSAIISYNTTNIEAHALTVEHNHEHAHAEDVQITAYSVVPNLDKTQMVTADGDGPCKCGCIVKHCSKCYEATTTTGTDGKKTTTYSVVCPGLTEGGVKKDGYVCPMDITHQAWYESMMSITGIIDQILTPVLIILGTAGSIFVIVLGINFSKAESADKREEAKKRMINAIIGIVVTLLFLILVKLFTANAEEVVKFVNGVS